MQFQLAFAVNLNCLPSGPTAASPGRGRSIPWTCTTTSASAQPEVRPHPGYYISRCAHLTDSLPDLPVYTSPLLGKRLRKGFVRSTECVLSSVVISEEEEEVESTRAFIRAGPRESVYFGPGVRAGIVSCGGICPGINTVIRELTLCLQQYNAGSVFGIPHGYHGFRGQHWSQIGRGDVEGKHKVGGTMLGTSRGGFDLTTIVDAIEARNLDHLYVIGGDGTIMGVQKIFHEVTKRMLKTAVVSVPKTIDNDIPIIDRSFGFETAVEEAQRAIDAAYVEACSFPDCVSIVQLMGRNSGFIAMHSALASCEVDLCLIPEESFPIEGVLKYIDSVVRRKQRCVVVVAEGAGGEYVGTTKDIGRYLLEQVQAQGKYNTKYLDPTYQVRAVPTIASDNTFCTLLAHSAVHGAYAGYTGFSAGPINARNAYIPIDIVAGSQKKVDLSDRTWQRLVSTTGQPDWEV